jgi:branched-chain amino acid transport system substrate-binding protein
MRCRFACVVAGTVLIAGPGPGNAAPRNDRTDALLQIAIGVGRVASAASVCREISWPRIQALTEKFSDLIKASVTQGEAFSSIQQAFDQSAIEGQRTVSSKQTDCAAAVRELSELERAVGSQAPAEAPGEATSDPARTATVAAPPAPITTGAAPRQDPRQKRSR